MTIDMKVLDMSLPLLFFRVVGNDNNVDSTQHGDHSSGPMCNHKLTGKVIWISLRLLQTSRDCRSGAAWMHQKPTTVLQSQWHYVCHQHADFVTVSFSWFEVRQQKYKLSEENRNIGVHN